MRKLKRSNMVLINGGYCVLWQGPNQNSGDNANADPLPYQYCNMCLFVNAVSQDPNITFCPL